MHVIRTSSFGDGPYRVRLKRAHYRIIRIERKRDQTIIDNVVFF